MEKLRGWLEAPATVAAWVGRDLARVLPRQLRKARLAALETVPREAVQAHWKAAFPGLPMDADDPDWANALALLQTIDRNRPLLRRLLQAEARGDAGWALRHPRNQAFLERVRKADVDPDGWLAPASRTLEVGGDTLTAYRETRPLRVLQMGNLFGTCLSTGDALTFSTVANAVEVNKCVL